LVQANAGSKLGDDLTQLTVLCDLVSACGVHGRQPLQQGSDRLVPQRLGQLSLCFKAIAFNALLKRWEDGRRHQTAAGKLRGNGIPLARGVAIDPLTVVLAEFTNHPLKLIKPSRKGIEPIRLKIVRVATKGFCVFHCLRKLGVRRLLGVVVN